MRKIYSKIFGIDESTLIYAGKFKATFRYAIISFTFAQNAIDAIFLKRIGPEFLPLAYILTPVLIIIFSIAFSFLSSYINKKAALSGFLIFSALIYFFLRYFGSAPGWEFFAYLFVEVYLAFFTILFFTNLNETMNSRERKRAIPFILAGASAAAGTSAFIIVFLSKYVQMNIRDYLIIAAAFNFIALFYVLRIPAKNIRGYFRQNYFSKFISPDTKKDLMNIASTKSKYLRLFLVMMLFSFALATLIDYQFKLKLAANALTEQDISGFLGMFRGVSNVALSIFQNYIFARIIPFIGTLNIFNIYPIILSIGALFLVYFAGFYASFIMKLSAEIFKKMFEDAAIQFGYNPVPLLHKGRIISIVEGLIKPLSLVAVGALLFYVKKFDPRVVYYLIGGFSLLYLFISVKLRKEYFGAFYKKIRTENLLLEKKLPEIFKKDIDEDNLKRYIEGNSAEMEEFSLYYLAKLEKKVNDDMLNHIFDKFAMKYPIAMGQYLVSNYSVEKCLQFLPASEKEMKLEILKGLLDGEFTPSEYLDAFSDRERYLSELPHSYGKRLFSLMPHDSLEVKSIGAVLDILKTAPYSIGSFTSDFTEFDFEPSRFDEVYSLASSFDMDELIPYLRGGFDNLESGDAIRLIGLFIEKGEAVPMSKDRISAVIRREIERASLFAHLFYISNKKRGGDYQLYEYLREKTALLLKIAVRFFMDDAAVEALKNSDLANSYLASEVLLYLEERSQKLRGPAKTIMKDVLGVVDSVYASKKIRKVSLTPNLRFSSMESYLLKYFAEKYQMQLPREVILKENEEMEKIMESLLLLKKVEFFSEISLLKLEGLAMMASKGKYKMGDVIIRQDQAGDKLYILKSGKAEIYKRVGPIITPLKILQRGDWFGELSIISDSNTHLASVKATSDDMETIEIPKAAFRTFISNNPEVSFRIFDVLVTYISQDQSLGDEYEIG